MMHLRFLLNALFILIAWPTFACSFALSSFCTTVNSQQNELVILKGMITETFPNGVKFDVFEALRGEESRSSITIWDGEPFDCNGPFELPATALGEVGDSIIIAVPLIDSIVSNWEVLGDYRAPFHFANTSALKIEDNKVKGFISGGPIPGTSIYELAYDDFISDLVEENDCLQLISSTDAPVLDGNLHFFPNPATNQITLTLPQEVTRAEYRIFSMAGQLAQAGTLSQQVVDLWLRPGLYLVEVRAQEGIFRREKLVVKQR